MVKGKQKLKTYEVHTMSLFTLSRNAPRNGIAGTIGPFYTGTKYNLTGYIGNGSAGSNGFAGSLSPAQQIAASATTSSSTSGMPISQRAYEDMAVNRVKGATQSAIEAARRQAQRMGVNPASGRYAAVEDDAQYGAAAQIAAAGTQASWDWLKNAQAQNQFEQKLALEREALNRSANQGLSSYSRNYNSGKNSKKALQDAEARLERENLYKLIPTLTDQKQRQQALDYLFNNASETGKRGLQSLNLRYKDYSTYL